MNLNEKIFIGNKKKKKIENNLHYGGLKCAVAIFCWYSAVFTRRRLRRVFFMFTHTKSLKKKKIYLHI